MMTRVVGCNRTDRCILLYLLEASMGPSAKLSRITPMGNMMRTKEKRHGKAGTAIYNHQYESWFVLLEM